ncbi:glycosyl transferase family 39 [Teichococcus cervicalis]|nr:glycosyl transferase family 39 [Pseudoroseomonas cervicalis]
MNSAASHTPRSTALRALALAAGLAAGLAAAPGLALAADANRGPVTDPGPLDIPMAVTQLHEVAHGGGVPPGPAGRNASAEGNPMAVPMAVSRYHDPADALNG